MGKYQPLDNLEFLPEPGKFYDESQWDIRDGLWSDTYAELDPNNYDGSVLKIIDLSDGSEYLYSGYQLRRFINVRKVYRIDYIPEKNSFVFLFEGEKDGERKFCFVRNKLCTTKSQPTIDITMIGESGEMLFLPDNRILCKNNQDNWQIFELETATTSDFQSEVSKLLDNIHYEYYHSEGGDIILMFHFIDYCGTREALFTLLDAKTFQVIGGVYNTYDEQVVILRENSKLEKVFKHESRRIRKNLKKEVGRKEEILMDKVRSIIP